MKKTLVSLAALLIAMPVMAAEDNCAYSPLQNLIRNVRSVNEINELLQRGVVFDENVRCGGSLIQLAVLRGNPDVLQAILNQDRARANAKVVLDYSNKSSYGNDTKEIPVILFAARYAPNAEVVQKLVEAGADITSADAQGRGVLWYMDQNPVLRNTALSDRLNSLMLSALVPKQTRPSFQFGGNGVPAGQNQQAQQQQVQQQPVVSNGPSVVEAEN